MNSENEQSIEKLETELHIILENTFDFVARFDRDLRCIYVNKRVVDVFGYSENYYLGKRSDELGLPKSTSRILNLYIENALRHKKRQKFQIESELNNEKKWFLIKIIPEIKEELYFSSILIIAQDITDQTRLITKRKRKSLAEH